VKSRVETEKIDPAEEQDMRRQLDPMACQRVEAWVGTRGQNLRALLSTLQNILWEDAKNKWNPVNLAALQTGENLKKTYRKAMLLVHTDKVVDCRLEDRLIAEHVFNVLHEAAKNEPSLKS